MLDDPQTIRHYQRLTDALSDFQSRGYRYDELRMYLNGYMAALRNAYALDSYLVNRLEEQANRFLLDMVAGNAPEVQPEPERGY
ncbi:DUF6761 family protein [Geitlerinema sp. PCC 9228]|jgi:hypothetical protein|uniref:DUF6761 family protein n=1 Tax=Geitlerinema sp. PCC 9228 TaxID=111611 RepID=UPI0008F9DD75|nr:DUF6761 family protein [Geitlerinema sp. PCC 9228]